jgi:undecaprenyl-diphosphatase
MSLVHAVVLGALEGITEFLPVSSTGHLLVAQKALGLSETPAQKEASDSYAICIQLGAILAVLLVSFGRIGRMLRGIVGRDADGARLLRNLLIAFLPAVAAGLLLEAPMKRFLFGPWPVAAAWIAGGVALLLIARRKTDGAARLDHQLELVEREGDGPSHFLVARRDAGADQFPVDRFQAGQVLVSRQQFRFERLKPRR